MEEIEVPVPAAEETVIYFDELVARFPYNPVTDNGRGFLAPFARVLGHVLYLAGRYDDKNGPTPEKARDELTGALSHWNNMTTELGFSEKAQEEVRLIGQILEHAAAQIDSWSKDDGLKNTQKIANRLAQFAANLDREVLGIPNSDAGYIL